MNLNKRIIGIGLALLVGMNFSASFAMAQSWQDMQNDRNAIRQDQSEIRHDHREMRNDLHHHDYGAAEEEQQEIRSREQQLRDQRQDLHSDWMQREERDHDNDRD